MSASATATPCKLVILISGSGSNLQAFIDKCQSGELHATISAVFSNRPDAYGLQRASAAGLVTEMVDHSGFSSREQFDAELMRRIDDYEPDLVILAGFMRILTPAFVAHFHGRLLNIHPSLLPKYPGLNTHQRAIEAGDTEAGATVHFVTEELDGGPAIIQARVPVHANDSAQTLAKRILSKEHIIYPLAVKWYAEKRLRLVNGRCELDGQVLESSGWQLQS